MPASERFVTTLKAAARIQARILDRRDSVASAG
jgi:hypothetical protein